MRANVKIFIVAGLLVGLALAMLVSPFASSSPDGMEKVAAEEGFGDAADDHALADAPLADYGVEGVDDEKVGTALAGLIGTMATFGIALGLFGLLRIVRERSDRTMVSSG